LENGTLAERIAPSLFKKTHRKKITVQKMLENNKWIDHIFPPCTQDEVSELVTLWETINDTRLITGVEDGIKWRWTENGEYTTKSAYRIQFEGTFSEIRPMPIWKAEMEPKCCSFAWTLLRKKF
jgi:hypothetical protein